ncbi:hypothetical protein JCM24511_03254 [Saitozyma sp. JCM 24511]|nr:hypothetical protein JCM24511_03254 [Saitozyma sp. JCM 24511]
MPPSSSSTSAAAAQPARPAPASASRQTRSPARFPIPLPLPLLLPILILLLAAFIPAPPPSEQLASLSQGLDKPGKVLLLTAHPDDEVMFFAPTVMALVSAGWEVSGLCLSTGNADGLGETRRHELSLAYSALGVPGERVMVIDHPLLQDDMSRSWPLPIIQSVLDAHLDDHPADLMVTFDPTGISSHPNHASLAGVIPSNTHIRVMHLLSPPLATKYIGQLAATLSNVRRFLVGTPVDPAALAALLPDQLTGAFDVLVGQERGPGKDASRTTTITSSPDAYWAAVQAMREHRTQMVWFRYLYLAFSRLMWVNDLVEVR